VVNAAIYGGGILANPSGDNRNYGYRPATPETLKAIDAMEQACHESGTDLATAALQASVSDPRVNATIVGMSKPSRLSRIVAGLSAELHPGLLEHLAELLPEQHNWLDFQRQS
jgi:D-threo-aldose 1-dehydrogenase